MKTVTVIYEGVSPEEVASPSLKCIVSYDDVERIDVFSDKYLPQDDGKGIGCLLLRYRFSATRINRYTERRLFYKRDS